ncbi:MAG: YHS domain-containing (seleno)protein [Patiriisocius sp.]|uniref:YHS domain-containing (seleno)protein n=1 Tax=Patiriisocius sp. TaxID=2822396 RepID=UPI003EF39D1C
MKNLILLVSIAFLASSCGTSKGTINTNNKGFIANGYDVTEYFEGNATEGNDLYISTYNGASYKFMNASNKAMFDKNPAKYEPQYGGFCAYAVGDSNSKVDINPESFLIEDGKLYLFYDTVFADTKQKWLDENPMMLKQNADENWKSLKNKN